MSGNPAPSGRRAVERRRRVKRNGMAPRAEGKRDTAEPRRVTTKGKVFTGHARGTASLFSALRSTTPSASLSNAVTASCYRISLGVTEITYHATNSAYSAHQQRNRHGPPGDNQIAALPAHHSLSSLGTPPAQATLYLTTTQCEMSQCCRRCSFYCQFMKSVYVQRPARSQQTQRAELSRDKFQSTHNNDLRGWPRFSASAGISTCPFASLGPTPSPPRPSCDLAGSLQEGADRNDFPTPLQHLPLNARSPYGYSAEASRTARDEISMLSCRRSQEWTNQWAAVFETAPIAVGLPLRGPMFNALQILIVRRQVIGKSLDMIDTHVQQMSEPITPPTLSHPAFHSFVRFPISGAEPLSQVRQVSHNRCDCGRTPSLERH